MKRIGRIKPCGVSFFRSDRFKGLNAHNAMRTERNFRFFNGIENGRHLLYRLCRLGCKGLTNGIGRFVGINSIQNQVLVGQSQIGQFRTGTGGFGEAHRFRTGNEGQQCLLRILERIDDFFVERLLVRQARDGAETRATGFVARDKVVPG